MSKLLVANWKMNPKTTAEAARLARASDAKNVVIAPPFVYLSAVKKTLRKASLGSQDVFWEVEGAYTGQVSPAMLKALGVRYVILGHSERREHAKESDEMINKKVKAALVSGLKVILCVGEKWEVRKKGLPAAKAFVRQQLTKDLRKIPVRNVIVAYEPVWAIGTGKADDPKNAAEMAWYIKLLLGVKTKVLYGGSLKKGNAVGFLKERDIDGALVGGASLRMREFKHIISVAEKM